MFPAKQHHELHQAALQKRNGSKPAYCTTLNDAANRLVEELATLYTSGESHLRWYVEVKTFEVEGLSFDPKDFLGGHPNSLKTTLRLETLFGDAFFPLFHSQIDATQFDWYMFSTNMLYGENTVCRFSVDLAVKEAATALVTSTHA